MKKKSIKKMSMIELVQAADSYLRGCEMKEEKLKDATPVLRRLGERLDISSDEAMILCGLLNQGGFYKIDIGDLCRYYECPNIQLLRYTKLLKSLTDKDLLYNREENCYDISAILINAIEENKKPEQPNYKGLDAPEWFYTLNSILEDKEYNKITYRRMIRTLQQLIDDNPHLEVVKRLQKMEDDIETQLLLLLTMNLYVQNNDDMVGGHDIEEFYDTRREGRHVAIIVQRGSHKYLQDEWIEYYNDDGRANPQYWKLTDKAKKELLSELNLSPAVKTPAGLLESQKITPKSLYFNADVQKQVDKLRSLMEPDRFRHIQERLEQNGMRRGFACIFYGSPGTGKTETALQLARETGRAIIQVDISTMRSKWVGETEKNIKGVFERYREYCKKNGDTPILLFNEADAVLCKRNDGTTSVDKMENAMQNIILQEMETLDGIMIATTNLSNNLDPAFERRFLYKIEFQKPTAQESRHIWHTMLPSLSDDEALALARKYNFSGGQIENIARKQLVNNILSDSDDIDLSAIYEACDHELLFRTHTHKIGFY